MIAVCAPIALALTGVYRRSGIGTIEVRSLVLGAALLGLIASLADLDTSHRESIPVFAGTCAATAGLWAVSRLVDVRRSVRERVVVVGSGLAAARFASAAMRYRPGRFEFVGYVDDRRDNGDSALWTWLGELDRLDEIVVEAKADRVVVAFSDRGDSALLDVVRRCDKLDVVVDLVPRFFDFLGGSTHASYALGALPVVSIRSATSRWAMALVKRVIDFIVATALLLAVSPALIVIAFLIALEDGRPILFRQARIGRGGRPFSILKFRTMVDRRPSHTAAEHELVESNGGVAPLVSALKTTLAPPTTRVGRVLRRWSLDELPQLVNVLLGHMSLVGPRPLREFEVDALADWERARLAVRPGMTGLWQVLGRSSIPWEERMRLDYLYVRHASMTQEAQIVARTLPAVMKGRGAL